MQSPVEPAEYLDMYPEILVPEEAKLRWIETRNGAIAGPRALVERLGWEVGDRIPIQPTIWRQQGRGDDAWEFELVGVYDADVEGFDQTQFLFRYDFFDEARSFGRGQVGWFMVRIADPDRAPPRSPPPSTAPSGTPPPKRRASPRERSPRGFANQVGNLGLIVTSILGGRLLHHPAGRRQHHGAVGAGADRRDRPAEGPGFHLRPRAAARAHGSR